MRHYSHASQDTVEDAMHRRKEGTLKSGKSGKKVTSRKQAIAIGLSEAREKGQKVPKKAASSSSGSSSKSRTSRSSSGSTTTRGRKTSKRK
jgi:hypothetical protein